ncbi:L,D-transpeptidase family protein [Roseixanthobacter glucoisosaccharinicivorans]|uniref:L,D-transpeptidase family protein n=1 Tax=Roseixanthobacter glucoisosaccharinicivorans TaxID=3119923 RepID=UPI003729C34F
MARQDKKAFATAAILACALIAGAPAGIAESPVMGDAGMGTATGPAAAPPVPPAGDSAPSHLHGQAPAPGDASPEPREAPRAAETAPQQPSQASAIASPGTSGGVERVLEAIRPAPAQSAAPSQAPAPTQAATSPDPASPDVSTPVSSASSSAPQPAEEDPQAAIDRMAQPANAELTAPPAALAPPPRAAALPPAQPEAAASSPSASSSSAGAPETSPAPAAPSVAAVPPSPPVDTTPAQAAAPAASTPAPSAPTRTAAPAAPSTPTTPAPAAVAADPLAPIAEQIAKLLSVPGADALVGSAKEQEALLSFYTARMDAPVFVDASGFNARGKAVLARLAAAAEDGLEPSDYARPRLSPGADPLALARAELKLAASALLYARHAEAGRFDPSRISDLIAATRTFPDPHEVLANLSTASDASAALEAYNPPQEGYRALKAQLVSSRTAPVAAPIVRIPPGPTLRPGDVDARVPALRARLGVRGGANDRLYDADLADAVKMFQASSGLEPDGVIGAGTLSAFNLAAAARSVDRTADIIANMERWRWLPRDLGATRVMVNIPEFTVRIYDNNREVHETRVVVGKPETPTPLLSHDMEYVVLNPYWNIPPSIARKEMLPKLQADPYFLARQGMEVVRNGRVVDPGTVNWNAGLGGYSFRQPPGERNALGRIKFMFPNNQSVYLHDTPSKALFARDKRAFSHGCIRVQEPLKFGEVIFNLGLGSTEWTDTKIGKMLGGAERYVNLKHHIPVHLVYFTAFVENGRLQMREDVYGLNEKVKAQLGLSGGQTMAAGRPQSAAR